MAEQEKLANHVVVCIPLYSAIPSSTFASLITSIFGTIHLFKKLGFSFTKGTYVHIARKLIAENVLKIDGKDPIDYLLWIDSDHVFRGQDLANLFISAKRTNADMLSGFYVAKEYPHEPIMYKQVKDGFAHATDVPKKSFIEADGVGFGFLLMKMNVLKTLAKKYKVEELFNPYDKDFKKEIGEDLHFCKFAKKEGFKIIVNSAIQIGHHGGVITPEIFYALKESKENQPKS